MGIFSRAKKQQGWLSIAFLADGVCAASVRRPEGAKPVVELCRFLPSAAARAPETLEKLAREVHAANYRCGTVLAGGEYQVVSVEAPNVPIEELKTAVRWRLKDMLDFHVDDATIDVLDIPPDKNGAARAHMMFAVAARNSVIESCQTLFSTAKVALSVIDIPEMAQRNISTLMETPGRGLGMLSFHADGGLLTVTFNGELYLSRRIDVTLAQLLEADSEKQLACHNKITLELQRSLDHFDRQFHFITIAKLMLAPSGAPGLHEYLASNVYMPVEAFELSDVLDLGQQPELRDETEQQRFFLVLGAALRHEEVVL
jgi:MSHA biogenesis protein MshI